MAAVPLGMIRRELKDGGQRGKRTWPQRLLLLAGVGVAISCFVAAKFFWDARALLADIPRIAVNPEVLATPGEPGDPQNFLIIGTDSDAGLDPDDQVRGGREDLTKILADTILILRADPSNGEAQLLSIPRDLNVQVAGSSELRINAALQVGGVESLIETIDDNLSVPIDHFVVVDFAGFSELVDLVGGVPLYFPHPTRDIPSLLAVPNAGCWVLDGSEALSYVRARNIEQEIDGTWESLGDLRPDIARVERQQEFLVLALEQVLEEGGSDLGKIDDFVKTGVQAVTLDQRLTPGELIDLGNAFSDIDTNAVAISTLPVADLQDSTGRYQGEQLIEAQAAPILDIFRGLSGGVRPEDVTVLAYSPDESQLERIGGELTQRGFELDRADETSSIERTTIRVGAEHVALGSLLARYAVTLPEIEVVDDHTFEAGSVELLIGNDWSGLRSFPRPADEVEEAIAAAVSVHSSTGRHLVEPADPEISTDPTVEASPTTDGSTTSDTVATPDSSGPSATVAPTTTLGMGRPPETVTCSPLGGS